MSRRLKLALRENGGFVGTPTVCRGTSTSPFSELREPILINFGFLKSSEVDFPIFYFLWSFHCSMTNFQSNIGGVEADLLPSDRVSGSMIFLR